MGSHSKPSVVLLEGKTGSMSKFTEAVLMAPRKIELRTREIPKLTGSQVLVKVVACGVCSTEIPVWLGKTQGARGASRRYYKFPSRLGHEPSGYVEDVGPDVKTLSVSDAVTGMANADSRSHFATHAIEDEKFWLKIPEGFKPEEVLGEPLACIENILQKKPAGNVLIVGDGFMSILVGNWLSESIIRSCVVIGHHDERLKWFPNATHKFNSYKLDTLSMVDTYGLVRGKIFEDDRSTPWRGGFDIALDFTGTMSGLQLAASLCKPKNRTPLLMCGVYDNEPFSLGHYMVNRGVVPIPCYPAQSDDFHGDLRNGVTPETIRQSRELITHFYKLEELGKAFEDAMGRRGGYIKGVVRI